MRFNLSDKITRLLGLKQNKIQNEKILQLHTNTQRQVFITKLVRQARVSPSNLPRDKNNKLLLNFNPLLARLNTILVGQYLQNKSFGFNT